MAKKIVVSAAQVSYHPKTDYIAHYDGEEELGGYGYGATPEEAIADFRDGQDEDETEG